MKCCYLYHIFSPLFELERWRKNEEKVEAHLWRKDVLVKFTVFQIDGVQILQDAVGFFTREDADAEGRPLWYTEKDEKQCIMGMHLI